MNIPQWPQQLKCSNTSNRSPARVSWSTPASCYKLMLTTGLKLFRSGSISPKYGITNTLIFHASILSCCVVFSRLVHAKSSLQPRLNPVTPNRMEERTAAAWCWWTETASPTFCPTIPHCVHVSMLVGRPGGQPQPSSSVPIPHPQTQTKTGGAATADHPGGSIFKTLLQNGPTHQGWHTILSEDCQWGTWPLCCLKAQTFSPLHRRDRKQATNGVMMSASRPQETWLISRGSPAWMCATDWVCTSSAG